MTVDADTFTAHLHRLGAYPATLSEAERTSLDRDGFVALVGALPPTLVAKLAARLLALREPGAPKAMHEREAGCWRVDGVLDLHADFHAAWSNPRLLAAVHRLMGEPFQPVALNYRASLTGNGHQSFHHDTPFLGPPPSRGYVQSIVALVDFSAAGGATRVVPGSHRWDHSPAAGMADVNASHPQELALSGPAGTIFVLNGNTWHAGGLNRSAVPRHSLHASWMARTVTATELLCQRQPVPAAILAEIGPDAAAVLNPPAGG